jgi:hypothetical protein
MIGTLRVAVVSLIFWVPVFALLLWAFTFISASITFSWVFVAIIFGVAAVISGIIAAAIAL